MTGCTSTATKGWGGILEATGTMASVNPIRYRGYYYDAETGLYYLHSGTGDGSVSRFFLTRLPRTERKKSATGIYHVMLRGINHQQLFEDAEDYLRFLSILRECKEVSAYKL